MPVEACLGLVQLVRVGDAILRLRLRQRMDAGTQQAQAVGKHLCAQLGKAVMQLAAGFLRPDRRALLQQHRAGIEPCLHPHQADPGLGIAGLDRPLDRRGAAPAGQQRGMHVPAAVGRNGQHRARQDQAVGDHHHQVRGQCAQRLPGFGAAQRLRLQDRNAAGDGFELDRRSGKAAAATGGPVRLGVDGHDFVVPRGRAQRRHREFGGAGEHDPHRASLIGSGTPSSRAATGITAESAGASVGAW